jgi:hypothetical protein
MSAKKYLFAGALTLLSVSLAIADPPAVHPVTGEELIVDCLRGAPDAIDGDLSDWKLGAMIPAVIDSSAQINTGPASWSSSADCSGKFYMLWDDKNIYIAAIVEDDKISMTKSGADIWNADCIEVLFSTTDAEADHSWTNPTIHYQYGFNANNQRWNWCSMESGGQTEPDYLQVASTRTADGYICEAAIEYGRILALDFSPGNNIGLHLVIDDTDDTDREIQITWTGREAHDQSLGYGYLYLSDAAVTPGYSRAPKPPNGALIETTWATLNWQPGEFAASHDVYLGEDFDDVNEAARDSELFRGNVGLDSLYFLVGFANCPYPDGLIPGTTYYWRVDEVNAPPDEAVYKGKVWSFSIPSKAAREPIPADGAEFVPTNPTLTWTVGLGAKLHIVYFGEDFDTVNEATGEPTIGVARYTPEELQLAKTYYWRVDESDGSTVYKGEVWSFTTEGAVTGPYPADEAVDIKPSVTLTWNAGAVAASHDLYFGTDADAVKNATKSSPEYKGPKALGEESYKPADLSLETTYYWRIDEVNDISPDSPWPGHVWSFTTGAYFVIDDFEDYDAFENQIWYAWHDGLGYGALGTDPYYPGNGTGAAVGDESTASYTEETVVHGGGKSMPIAYDNNKPGYSRYSEVEHALTEQRDWTEEGVTELSLWFRGYPAASGSFVEAPAGTFTVTASGTDITGTSDEFHYAYKMLAGAGSIVAKVNSVQNTNDWAKAGVMIRESLDADSAHAMSFVTPGYGVVFEYRPSAGADNVGAAGQQTGITAPYWVKIDRNISGLFTASCSANGTTWQTLGTPETIPMSTNVYIGLGLSAHDAALTCEAVFSNVTTTGNVSGQWQHQDIGILSNDPEPLYVVVSNVAGNPVIIVNDDPAAAQIDTWTPWVIPLQTFADQGILLTDVDKITIGLGTRGNTTAGGSGKIFIDDIRLNRP